MTADLSSHDARSTERALSAAARVLARRGADRLGMADLAREIAVLSGADPGDLRRAYPTRLDLDYAVAVRAARTLVAAEAADPGAADSAADRMARLIRRHISHCWQNRVAEELRRRLLPTLRAIHPGRHRELVRLRREYREHIAGIVADGAAEGTFTVRDGEAATTAVLATLDTSLDWYDADADMALTELGDVCVDLIVHHQLGAPRG
ncbi:TetR family transcriptional regulator [Nocardiopsis trehalosi]|jgi:AcrR family transcriptional regulator|uniref:TetR family transcriptional regulator n=1 Tax=Nocardiopsis trehalosi TaxID=109329 RepID=UPI00082B5548|nr:TetR family transcriptional regulator [Nocardiopsis trehalosi]